MSVVGWGLRLIDVSLTEENRQVCFTDHLLPRVLQRARLARNSHPVTIQRRYHPPLVLLCLGMNGSLNF